MRLQKLLAAAGFASRRGAETLIEQGRVSVNGSTAKVGDRADPARDRVELDGESLVFEKPLYWILNKPRGVITTIRRHHGRPTVMDLLPPRVGRLFPVGRLDAETEGLVLLTNDGALAHTLLHPSLGSEREYRVTVRGPLEDRPRGRLERGLHLEDGRTAPASVRGVRLSADGSNTTFELVIREGRKRQIRRSLAALGLPLRKLVRIRMGPLRLGRLARGECRSLTREEVAGLRSHRAELEAARDARPRGSRRPRPDGPRTGKPRTDEPRTGKPRTGKPRTGKPRTDEPRTGKPRTDEPRTGNPRAGNPRTGNPRTDDPRTGKPRTGKPRTSKPREKPAGAAKARRPRGPRR